MVVVFPALMALYGTYFIWRHIIRQLQRRAAWVLSEDPERLGRVSCPSFRASHAVLRISATPAGMLPHRGRKRGGPAVAACSGTHAPVLPARHTRPQLLMGC